MIVVVDGGDKVDLGKLVQVDGDHVSVGNGFIDVDGDDVKINGNGHSRLTWGHSSRQLAIFAVTDVRMLSSLSRCCGQDWAGQRF